MIKPVENGHISSEFGMRKIQLPGQNAPTESFHCGIDIGAPSSDPAPRIVLPISGIIHLAGWSSSFGERVWTHIIEGEYKGWYLVLAHMVKGSLNPELKAGMFIKEGTFLGIMGSTGLSLARHTHLELRDNPASPETPEHCLNPKTIRLLYP